MMYNMKAEEIQINGIKETIYKIFYNAETAVEIVASPQAAEDFVTLLNECGVEPCHVVDVAEDFFC